MLRAGAGSVSKQFLVEGADFSKGAGIDFALKMLRVQNNTAIRGMLEITKTIVR